MSELDKLMEYLMDINMPYERYETNKSWEDDDLIFTIDRHQICVPNQDKPIWDVICQRGSIGYEEGLLEAYGAIVDEEDDGDTVVGYLTAEDVIKRIRERHLNIVDNLIEMVREKYKKDEVDCAWK